MNIIHIANYGFRCTYSNSSICSVTVDYSDNSLLFESVYGDVNTIGMPSEIKLESYNEQFGISFSETENCFFVQSWEKGLYCFDMSEGAMLWHNKQRHASDILVDKSCIFCYFVGCGILKLDIKTGNSVERYSFVGNGIFKIVDEKMFLIGPKRHKIMLLDKSFEVIRSFGEKELNPNMCENFIIRQAHVSDNLLLISGIEYSNDEMLKCIKENCLERIGADSVFEREVPI